RRLPERGSGGARSAAPSRKANHCHLVLVDDWRCPAPADLATVARPADLALVAGPADLAAVAGPADLALVARPPDLAAVARPADLALVARPADPAALAGPTGLDLAESGLAVPRNRTSSDTPRPHRRGLGRSCRVVAAGLRTSSSHAR